MLGCELIIGKLGLVVTGLTVNWSMAFECCITTFTSLSRDVLKDKSFCAVHPTHDPSKPCVYVGITGLTPEERFANHKRGYKSAHFARNYGERLLPCLYEHLNPMSYKDAKAREVELADDLRRG